MIDIHSHILPKVDDGAIDMAMSLDMARQYISTGIYKVIATPHYIENTSYDYKLNKMVLEYFRIELRKSEIPLEVYLGNELYASMSTIEDITKGNAATLNGSRYILVELPMNDIPIYFEDLIYQSLIKGYVPIIAHPERNSKIIENPNNLLKYIEKGALAQLNLPSLEGRYGKSVQSTSTTLVKHNMIHFVGTDAHTNRMRSPNVIEGLEILRSLVSEDSYESMTHKNAMLLLEDRVIPILEPMEVIPSKQFKKYINKLFKKA